MVIGNLSHLMIMTFFLLSSSSIALIQVWLLIVASMVTITISYASVMKAEAGIFLQQVRGNTLSTSILWVVKALTQEGNLLFRECDI